MSECENCKKEHDGSYGSGRFCSTKCARGFSTKAKRSIINETVRIKLSKNKAFIIKPIKNKTTKVYTKKCMVCNNTFDAKVDTIKCCSSACSHELTARQVRGSHHTIKDSSRMGGFRENGGKSKQIHYTNWLGFNMSLNKEEIEIARILDEKKLNWKRNTKGFSYTTIENKKRKFYPDFVVNDNNYIEYKGWITEEMDWKMKNSIKENNLDLIIVVGNDKRYKNFGITIEEFKQWCG